MFMVMFVLDDPSQLEAILNAWEKNGISGATILESTGINRFRRARMVGTPFMAGINRLMNSPEESHYTLLAIVQDEQKAQLCLTAVESIVGDLIEPDTGVFCTWPLSSVKGVPHRPANKGQV